MPYIPRQLKYTQEHEWVSLEEDGTATIGISDFAQSELGDIVFVELPQEGDTLVHMESFGTIEAVKTVSDALRPGVRRSRRRQRAAGRRPDVDQRESLR